MATFGSCINFREKRFVKPGNRTVHGFICTTLVRSPNGYRLYCGVYVRRISWLTRPYLVAIEPFRRVLYPAMLRRIR
jgi:hypothetical protein